MVFPGSVVLEAWRRSGGQCERNRTSHGHIWRCPTKLSWAARGSEGTGAWEAHHINSNGLDTISNCEILCQSCHKATRSYGGQPGAQC